MSEEELNFSSIVPEKVDWQTDPRAEQLPQILQPSPPERAAGEVVSVPSPAEVSEEAKAKVTDPEGGEWEYNGLTPSRQVIVRRTAEDGAAETKMVDEATYNQWLGATSDTPPAGAKKDEADQPAAPQSALEQAIQDESQNPTAPSEEPVPHISQLPDYEGLPPPPEAKKTDEALERMQEHFKLSYEPRFDEGDKVRIFSYEKGEYEEGWEVEDTFTKTGKRKTTDYVVLKRVHKGVETKMEVPEARVAAWQDEEFKQRVLAWQANSEAAKLQQQLAEISNKEYWQLGEPDKKKVAMGVLGAMALQSVPGIPALEIALGTAAGSLGAVRWIRKKFNKGKVPEEAAEETTEGAKVEETEPEPSVESNEEEVAA